MKVLRFGMTVGVAAAIGLAAPVLAEDQAGKQTGTGGQSASDDGAPTTTGSTGSSAYGTGSTSASDPSAIRGPATSGSRRQQLSKELEEAAQKLHASNQGELQMAKAAQQMARSQQVKQYAKKLEKDHQKNDEQLQTLTRGMGVQLTGEAFQEKQKEGQEKMREIHSKQGAEFDEAYMKHMVEEHEKDVEEVKDAAKKARDEKQTQLASFLDQTHKTLEGHLKEAKEIERTLDRQQASGQGGASMGTGSGETGTGTPDSASGATGTGTPDSASGATGTGSEPSTSPGGSGTDSTGGSTDGTGRVGAGGSGRGSGGG